AASLGAAGHGTGRLDGSRFELAVADGPRALVRILRTVTDTGLEPAALAVREPSLDDAFLSLTGHRAGNGSDGRARDNGSDDPRTDDPPTDHTAATGRGATHARGAA